MTSRLSRATRIVVIGLLLLGLLFAVSGCATQGVDSDSTINLNVPSLDGSDNPVQISTTLQLLILMTVLSLAPAIFIMLTSFTRIIIVLAFIRSALSLPQVPPNQVLTGLSLFLTFFVMAPTWNIINAQALQPFLAGEIDQQQAFDAGIMPLREFMFKQTREDDLALFVDMADIPQPRNEDDVPTYVLIPSFVISELKTAFQMGVLIFIPFLVLDVVVASATMSMGMMMLPPSLISLPFKLLLFVMVDGWHLIVRSLLVSFG